jgi:mono/diheme cytochrome c family protein
MTSSRSSASSLAHAALGAVTMAASLGAASCAPDKMPFTETETHVFAGGIEVNGHELNLGYQAYTRYCYACHGVEGDGRGPASYAYRPPPRNFQLGIFKFARMRSSDDVPNDEDLLRIVQGGLHGTPMLAWDIPEDQLRYILQYIKTFSPKRWEKKKKTGEPVKTLDVWEAPKDPWAGKDIEAVQRGKELYHFKAECVNCHPAYGGKKELYEMSVAANKREPDIFKPLTGFRDDFYGSVAKDSSEYGVSPGEGKAAPPVRILPPDFTFNQVRSVRDGHEMEDLFRVISYGVYPVMPAWQGALEDKDIWAIAHFVKSLMATRDTPAASATRARYDTQGAFEVPKPVEEKAPEPAPAPAPEPDPKKDAPKHK